MEPSWLIFDEPTAHLDPWSRQTFGYMLKSLQRKKRWNYSYFTVTRRLRRV